VDLKQVEAFRDSIIAFNQRQNKIKVHMGGSYVDRIVLSKRFFAFDFLEHDRVFWEKFHEREEQASDSSAQGSATAGNEVMVHCQNFPKKCGCHQGLAGEHNHPLLGQGDGLAPDGHRAVQREVGQPEQCVFLEGCGVKH
jgi:hypothetical protein